MTTAARPDFQDIQAFAEALPVRGTLLGLDLGTKTIGVAVSDLTRLIASPVETLRRTKQGVDIATLLALATKLEAVGIVLGFPVNLDGSKGPRAQATGSFARALAAATPLPLLLYDERWSTVSAERSLLEADTSRAKRADRIDMVAATIILQAAIERLSNVASPDRR